MSTMYVYYRGDLIQARSYDFECHKKRILAELRKLYGKRFDECEIKDEAEAKVVLPKSNYKKGSLPAKALMRKSKAGHAIKLIKNQ